MFIRIFILFIIFSLGVSAVLFLQGKNQHLSDIETAAFSGSLSKFDDYMKTFSKQNQDDRWLTLKKAELQTDCKEEIRATPLPRTIMSEISFKGSERNPFSGSWIQSYRLDYCNNQKQINILYTVYDGAPPESRLMLDGTSLADITTQSDGIIHAIRASRVHFLGCNAWAVLDTEFLGAVPSGQNGAWQEEWEVLGCGAKFDVLMSFYPTIGFSTQIKVDSSRRKL